MSAHDPDFIRRIELERADAAKKALKEGIQKIEKHAVDSGSYRAAKRLFTRLLEEEMSKY